MTARKRIAIESLFPVRRTRSQVNRNQSLNNTARIGSRLKLLSRQVVLI
nr:MAG TPA: hypothetical protein [Caudoviricetes sp.]